MGGEFPAGGAIGGGCQGTGPPIGRIGCGIPPRPCSAARLVKLGLKFWAIILAMNTKISLIAQRFGRLTVIEPSQRRNHRTMWRCQCDCGSTCVVWSISLRKGATKSCGCLRAEVTRKRVTTHGASKSPEFQAWAEILKRCLNVNSKAFPHYGGRGVNICQRWRNSFENFLADMGRRPAGRCGLRPLYSIDRINNDGNYEPSNCRWATVSEQNKNRRQFRKH